ncbi:putative trypsin-like serine protease precursor [Neoconidiobolus thromboides FSU 785]|nr:putative trypsin-like serine protease precursor [Neoconidiobolus thromboides FSU 785]
MKSKLVLTLLGIAFASRISFINPAVPIVGGNEVSPKFKYLWMVPITVMDFHTRGGILYNRNTVVTNAQFSLDEGIQLTAHVHRHNLEIYESSEKGKTYNVLKHIVHLKYKKDTYSYDVAIWKLDAQSEPSTGIKLNDDKYSNADNTLLKVIGRGTDTSETSETSSALNEVKVPVYNITKCKQAYPKLDAESQFCAGYPKGGKYAWIGDSGGPIFIQGGSDTVLVSTISCGYDCGREGFLGIYTRASAITDFIKKNSS